jgi:hypothetical protein
MKKIIVKLVNEVNWNVIAIIIGYILITTYNLHSHRFTGIARIAINENPFTFTIFVAFLVSAFCVINRLLG